MEIIYLHDRREKDAFAERAAKRFAEDNKILTYTDEEPDSGCFFAVRWGLGDDCVLVFKIDEPTVYQQLIRAFEKPVGRENDS